MTAPTNTVTSATPNVGVREDLENNIYRVAPEETPFVSNIGTTKATNIYHEWQTESLATASATNAQLEGDDYALGAPNLTTRLGNYMQIVAKAGGVSRTQEVVNKAGRDSELARQKVLKTIEMKRDLETRVIGNYASVAESGATTRKTAGILAFLTSNDSRGSGGSDGGFSSGIVAAATNGTQRTFTEDLVKGVLATVFSNGGKVSQAYMSATHKQQFSAFTGIADIRADVSGKSQATIYGGADVYVSDFGAITLIPHAYGLTRDCVLVDPKMAAIATLDGLKSKPLASNGDNEKFLLTMEKGLVIKNEKAHGVVADLT
ncbi:DUF5309 domain-containing protein [Phenylobacterium sp.]|uniref:DUF5309 domain-containing protein n=1 Tax=Phenylobacterium sp. TaxID=1871053 RepID=UPI0035AFE534